MKKILIFLCIGTALIAMDDSYTRSLAIPGDLQSAELQSKSPVATTQLATYFPSTDELISKHAEEITNSAKKYLKEAMAQGKQLGTSELTTHLLERHNKVKAQVRKAEENTGVHPFVLCTQACELHVAALINEKFALQKQQATHP